MERCHPSRVCAPYLSIRSGALYRRFPWPGCIGGSDAACDVCELLGGARVTVLSANTPGGQTLRLHAAEIDPVTQAATLRLDSIADREECADLVGPARFGAGSARRAAPTSLRPGRTPAPDENASLARGSRRDLKDAIASP